MVDLIEIAELTPTIRATVAFGFFCFAAVLAFAVLAFAVLLSGFATDRAERSEPPNLKRILIVVGNPLLIPLVVVPIQIVVGIRTVPCLITAGAGFLLSIVILVGSLVRQFR